MSENNTQIPEKGIENEKNTSIGVSQTQATPPQGKQTTIQGKADLTMKRSNTKSNRRKPAEQITSKSTAAHSEAANQTAASQTVEVKKDEAIPSHEEKEANKIDTQPVIIKQSGGKSLSLLAILIALGIGVGGYFWGKQHLNEMEQQVTTLSVALSKLQNLQQQQTSSQPPQPHIQDNSTELEAQINALQTKHSQLAQHTQSEIQQLTAALDLQKTENSELRNQLNKLSFNNKTAPHDWLMSEADFLLTNAQRKLVLDSDIDTIISLLQEANKTLQKVSTSQALAIRTAISNDLNQLKNINEVDRDLIMSQLSLLVSQVDNLKVLALNPTDHKTGISDSLNDWQQNLEKSASSFLDHFIRVRKKDLNRPELLAPNQDIFLKENIRLSLQMALSAVPRQQNEVYKQSLDSVANWVRSYFDSDDYSVQQFLQQVDQLKELSIYVNAPQQLSSWLALSTLLNRDHRALEQFSKSEANKTATEENILPEKAGNTTQTEESSAANASPNPAPQSDETPASTHDTVESGASSTTHTAQ